MNRFILAPDSFKGTLTAEEVCEILSAAILKHFPYASVVSIPMADGGEGMTNAYLKLLHGEKKQLAVCGPMGEPVLCEYGVLPDGTAVAEMADCAGLTLVGRNKDPLRATTFGVGQLLQHLSVSGVKKLLLGIGGSATNDLGLGMAEALGFRFLDQNGTQIVPLPVNFSKIHKVEMPKQKLTLDITVACDVDNPLCGPTGATFTFGPQKGVPQEALKHLDHEIDRLASLVEVQTGTDIHTLPGAGAAGGLGAALAAFTGAKLRPGIEMLLDAAGFDQLLPKADLVFTGEGRIDWQSVHGKVPVGVARRAKQSGVPCIALCGSIGTGAEAVYSEGVTALFSSVADISDFEQVKRNCRENLRQLADSVLRILAMRNPPENFMG